MNYFLTVVLSIFFSTALAQGPTVPTRMEFAGIKLRIQESGRKDIQESVDMLTRSSTHYNIMIERARSYFPIIERIFKEENLPDDFKYLCLQESALIPDAVSSSDAVGYWQFKDFTAIETGLRVDRSIDERMNIVSSTRAAAKYLKKNNSFFDNWLHALQAYQMGAGGAMRVLDDESGVKSMTIDKKTYWYVRKFLAHKVAYEGVTEGEAKIKLSEYTNTGGKTLRDISKDVDVSEEELEAYNKWLKRGRIPNDKNYVVIVPSEKAISKSNTQVIAKKEDSNTHNLPSDADAIEYKFAEQENFPRIEDKKNRLASINGLPGIIATGNGDVADLAAKGGVSLSRFLKYNDIDIDHNIIKDEVFYLKRKRGKAKAYYHVLQPGESIWEVSQKYGVRLKRLKAKNRIRKDDPELKPGRVIWLRYVRPARIDIEYRKVEKPKEIQKEPTPKVVENEKKQEQKIEEISESNTSNTVVQPLAHSEGIVEKEVEETSIAIDNNQQLDSVRRIHKVSAGQTYYSIANEYNSNLRDILKWNNLDINDKLAIDQKLIIYEFTLENNKEKPKKETKTKETSFYTVKPGDTLYQIARAHDMTVEELMELNGKDNFNLKMGEKIKINEEIAE